MSDEQTHSAVLENAVLENVVEIADDKKSRRQPRYHVILWNDDDHSYDYVIRMMKELFGHPETRGMTIAKEVDSSGKAVCLTTTMEHAELKRDQIRAYGRDRLIARCKGSMSASIEPVPEEFV
ncbi:MAG: ATP-dependent Clp protease adaptor ClpS [Planctomycetota bacterium]